MADPPPPDLGPSSSPPGPLGHQGHAQANFWNPKRHQRVAPQTRSRKRRPQWMVYRPGDQPGFTPARPPNAGRGPQIPQQQLPPQCQYMQVSPPKFGGQQLQQLPQQNGFGTQPSNFAPIPRAQQALHLEQALLARQSHAQNLRQPSPLAQFQQPQQPQFTPGLNFQLNQQPSFGQPDPFPSGRHPFGPHSCPQPIFARPPQQRAPFGLGTPQLNAYARQVYQDMNTQSPTEFVHGSSLSPPNPILHHPQPRRNSFTAMAGHRRQSSMGSNLGDSFTKCDTMAPASTTRPSSPPNPSSLIQSTSNLGGTASKLDPQLREPSDGDEKAIKAERTFETNPSSESASQVDGYIVPHEQEGSDDEFVEKMRADKAHIDTVLDDIFAGLKLQLNDAVTLHGGEVWGEKDLDRGVPFMKASIFNDQAQVDECASLGGDQKGQRFVLLSHGNRLLTSTQYAAQVVQDHHQNVNRYTMHLGVPPPDADKVFLMYPNMLGMMNMRDFHPDTAALDLVPSAGWFDQYFPKGIDAKVWYDQITTLEQNIDLWLPLPLLSLMSWFGDTPYGIAIDCPTEVQVATLPGRECEFTKDEAMTLMNSTMDRYRTGLDKKPQRTWELYRRIFLTKHKWVPTEERMQVLDLMFQIDLVYWMQGMAPQALHPWSKYKRNELCVMDSRPLCPLNDGP